MRIPAITGIRGLAAVAVMFYHIPQLPVFERFAVPLVSRAYLCVDLFFVLSGFVISIGYHKRVVERLSPGSYGDFLINRMARVFPLHAIVALAFALRIALNVSGDASTTLTAPDLIANLLMIQSWGLGTHALAGNSWSVSTELVAYLLFPAIGLWADRRLGWLLVAVSIAVLLMIATSGLGVKGPMDVVQRTSLLPVLRCLAGFSIGVFAHRIADRPALRRLLGGDMAFVLICAAIALAFLVPRGDVLVVALCPLLVLSCYYDGRVVRKVMANPVSYHLGLISYSIYLWHPLFRDVGGRALQIAHARGIVGGARMFLAVTILVTWLACWVSYLLIEVRGHIAVKALFGQPERRPEVIAATSDGARP